MRVKLSKQVFIVVASVLLCIITSHSYAEASKQCFLTSNLPGLKTEAWWVSKSTVADLKTHQQLSKRLRTSSSAGSADSLFPLKGHRLVPGDGDTLTLRQRFPGWSGLTDTGSINTLTIYSPKSLVGEGEITVGGTDGPLIFLTHGVPAFRNFCFGYAVKGTISFEVRGSSQDLVAREVFERVLETIGHDAAIARISLEANLVSSRAWPEECGRCIFDGHLVFIKTDLSALQE